MNKNQIKILVLDDESPIRSLVTEVLRSEGYTVEDFAEGFKLLDYLQQHSIPDLVWLDLMLPDVQGLVLLRTLTSKFPSVKVICMTAYTSNEVIESAKTLGAFLFVSKPFHSVEEIIELTKEALED
jgi:two-component system response regulator (stage 0 sporulation protein F)